MHYRQKLELSLEFVKKIFKFVKILHMKKTVSFITILIAFLSNAQTFDLTKITPQQTFFNRQEFEYIDPSNIDFGDIDNDGDMDILVVGMLNNDKTIYLGINDGSGNFSEPLSPLETPQLDLVISAFFTDANNDGHLDILYTYFDSNQTQYSTYVSLNDGNGNYSNSFIVSNLNFTINDLSYLHFGGVVKFGDIDNDGDMDFVSFISDENIGIFLNDGSGDYTYTSLYPSQFSYLYPFQLLDYNHDGSIDIITRGVNNYQLLLNDGNGNFTTQNFTGLQFSNHIVFANLDDDDDIEAIAYLNDIKIYKNSGGNAFNISQSIPFDAFGTQDLVLKTCDMNNDGYQDILTLSSKPEKSGIFLNDQTGHFSRIDISLHKNDAFISFPVNQVPNINFGFNVTDIDGDGDKDLFYNLQEGIVLLNENQNYVPTGSCGISVSSSYEYPDFEGVDVADIDGDGYNDILVSGQNSQKNSTYIYKGNASGYEVLPSLELDKYFRVVGKVKFANLNNDNYPDILVIGFKDYNSKVCKAYINDGTGNFTEHDLSSNLHYGYPPDPPAFFIDDFNNDGIDDILIYSARNIVLHLNNGNGSFNPGITITSFQYTGYYTRVLDVNNDGFPDFISTNTVYINDGNGNFTSSTINGIDDVSWNKAMDIDGDNDIDLLFAKEGTVPRLYLNDGSGNYTYQMDWPGFKHKSKIADFNQDGKDDFFDPEEGIFINLGNYDFVKLDVPILSTGNYNASILVKDFTGDGFPDLIIPEPPHFKFYSIYENRGVIGEMQVATTPYVQLREDNYPTFNMTDVSNTKFQDYTVQGYYNNYSDAQNQINPLPNLVTNTTNYPKEVVARAVNNQGQTFRIKFDLDITPNLYVFHPEVPDINNDGTETIYVDNLYGVDHYYYSESDVHLGHPISGTVNITNAGLTLWVAGSLNGNTVGSPITFTLSGGTTPPNSDYNVGRIPFSMYQVNAIPQSVSDDMYSEVIPMDFNFDFFENTFQQLVIGSNGSVCFNTNLANQFQEWQITHPIPDISYSGNEIYGVYQDLDNSNADGTLGYAKIGTAPFRKFVTVFDNLPLYNNHQITATSQIVLYETYNFIDVQVKHREPNNNWNSGNGIIGIQNVYRNIAYFPSGRNVGNWVADDEAWRFRPQSFPDFQYILCDANNDGIETFDSNIILNHYGSGTGGVQCTLHLSENDANSNINQITGNFQNSTNAQTIFVRIDNNGTVTIKPVLLAAIDCNADYDIDGVPTLQEDLNTNGNFGDDDTDNDGIPNFMDDDDDGDMILTNIETLSFRTNRFLNYPDTDNDGIPNYLDNDDDNDGVLTIDEDYDGDGNPYNDDTNNDGIPDYLQQSVANGIIQLNNKELVIYPNPTKNGVNLKFNKMMHNISVSVIGFDGRKLSQNYFKEADYLKIDLPKEKGFYFIKVKSNEGVSLRKIIKR